MLARKFISAYHVSVILILFIAYMEAGWRTDFALGAVSVSIYVFPIMFIYGIGTSILIDWLMFKLPLQGVLNIVLSCLLHVSMGYLFGLVFFFPSIILDGAPGALFFSFVSIYGALAALLFFVVYQALRRVKLTKGWGQFAVIGMLLAPILVFAGLFGYLFSEAPTPEPYTQVDAVEFATSGNNTVTDLFPDQEGTVRLVVDGYHVERETRAKAISVELGKERYEVSFIERWSKDGKSGEYRMNYIIERGSSTYSGSEGEKLPYNR